MSRKTRHLKLKHQIKLLAQQRDTCKQIAAELKESDVKYRAILENIEDSYLEVDLTGHFLFFNSSFCILLGYSKEELTGKDNREVMNKENARKIFHVFRSVYDTKKPASHVIWEIIRKDGTKIDVEASISLITDAKGEAIGFRGIGRDITLKKQAEERFRRINQELKEAMEQSRAMAQDAARANAAKGMFLANISHEIRTPMNGILGMTELALGTQLTEEQREYLEMAMMSAHSLLGLINDLLDFSKMEAGEMELESIEFNLRSTLENTMGTLALKAHEKGLELICHIRPDVPTALVGDPGRLRQVIVNLAGNAIKFTDKGEVLIRVERESETGSSVTLHVMVSDTGIGIPQHTLDSIFQRFQQVDGSSTRKHGGMGLELSISKQLVELMGGEIHAESPNPFISRDPFCVHRQATHQAEPGSLFHFTAHFELSPSKNLTPPRLHRHDLEGMPILIVDDNATNRLLLQEILASWGLSPTTAADAQEALRLASRAFQNGTPYQLALLDMQMPTTNGFTLAERMKSTPFGENLKMIMLSSMGQKGDSKRCREAGISGYLSKPVKQSELLDTILMTMELQEEATVITRHTLCDLREQLNILLAEDNRINQTLAMNLLRTRGHRVTLATNGREAVEVFQQHDFDLILMDIQMPEMDGFEATRRIREWAQGNAAIPIIAMTAHAMKGDEEKCIDAGMDDYVSKPIQPATLFDVIDKVVRNTQKNKTTKASRGDTGNVFAPRSFDLAKAMETVLNDEDIFREIAELFLQELPDSLAKIRQGVVDKDGYTLERAAHSLKGSVGNFGADEAYKTAQHLELLGKQGKLERAAEEFSRLKKSVDDLAQELKLVLQGMNHENPDR
jgi:two-component system sensor histidine kinase/response regulator